MKMNVIYELNQGWIWSSSHAKVTWQDWVGKLIHVRVLSYRIGDRLTRRFLKSKTIFLPMLASMSDGMNIIDFLLNIHISNQLYLLFCKKSRIDSMLISFWNVVWDPMHHEKRTILSSSFLWACTLTNASWITTLSVFSWMDLPCQMNWKLQF